MDPTLEKEARVAYEAAIPEHDRTDEGFAVFIHGAQYGLQIAKTLVQLQALKLDEEGKETTPTT